MGKHFTVNYMLQKDSVKSRMDAGISFTEFSYMLLQAYDYLELLRREGVTLQLGGSDQWGNITAGIELIRRVDGAEAHALTVPLVTNAVGREVREDGSGRGVARRRADVAVRVLSVLAGDRGSRCRALPAVLHAA